MSRYFIISILFICLGYAGFSQEEETVQDSIPPVVNDTLPKNEKYGLRLGVDLHRPLTGFVNSDFFSLEIVGDYRISQKFFIAAEIGTVDRTKQDDQFNYTTTGSYIRAGFDYNAYENWLGMQNMIYAGMRVGYSTHEQTLNSYRIFNPDQTFGEGDTVITDGPLIGTYSGLSGVWVEAVFGIKAELFNNLFLGFSFRVKNLVSNTEAEEFSNLYIPGFNKVNDFSNFGGGFNYTISYLIPIYKKR